MANAVFRCRINIVCIYCACDQEMGGYFIVNGIERVVRMLIMQRRNYVRIVLATYNFTTCYYLSPLTRYGL